MTTDEDGFGGGKNINYYKYLLDENSGRLRRNYRFEYARHLLDAKSDESPQEISPEPALPPPPSTPLKQLRSAVLPPPPSTSPQQQFSMPSFNWPQELASFGDREIRWCYNFFHGKPSSENFAIKKNKLALFFERTIKNNETINLDEIEHLLGFDKIMALRNSNVMDLSWIQKNDHRLLVWLERRGLPEMGSMMLISDLTRLSYSTAFLSAFRNSPPKIPAERRYDLIIEYIDSIRFYTHDPQEKQKVLDTIKEMWLRDKTLDKPVKWLDPSDEKQLLWAWDYLRNRSRAAPIKEPLTPEEQYSAILASLDLTEVFNRERFENIDKKEFILKFRKAWYQKEYRRLEKVKKPYHLPLSKKSGRMLSKLAAVENQKAVKLLERLIETEYNKVCLDENGKEKYPHLP